LEMKEELNFSGQIGDCPPVEKAIRMALEK
jgi:hypothetical protein